MTTMQQQAPEPGRDPRPFRAIIDRIAELGRDLRSVEPLTGHFLVAGAAMTRSGELAPRQLAVAVLAAARALDPDRRAFADQLRGAAERLLLAGPRLVDAPAYESPLLAGRRS